MKAFTVLQWLKQCTNYTTSGEALSDSCEENNIGGALSEEDLI